MMFSVYGHLAPSVAIAKQLISKGHTVGYSCGTRSKGLLSKAGVHHFYPRDFTDNIAQNLLVPTAYQMYREAAKISDAETTRKCIQEVMRAVESFKPDVIYLDSLDFIAAAIVERYGIPYIHGNATAPFYFEKDIPAPGTGWDITKPRRNRLKLILYGLRIAIPAIRVYLGFRRAFKSIDPDWKKINLSGISPYLFLSFTTDQLEYTHKLFIPQVFYVGPSILEPEEDETPEFPWEKIDSKRPLVYIATGTLFPAMYEKLYRNALKALSDDNFPTPIQVVMAIGRNKHPRDFGPIPSNFIVVQYAPQIKLLQKADVAVVHGGANSVNEALRYGKPILAVHLGGDMIAMAQRVVHRGAGIRFHARKASVNRIRDAIIQLMENPEYKRNSRKIMNSFAECDGARTASDLIIRLADTKRPILRKEGAPSTLRGVNDLQGYLK